MMTVLLTIYLFLYRKNLKKIKGCLGNGNENNKTDEISIQETKLKDGSATDEPLLLPSQKSEENQGWHLGNDDDENYEINKLIF